MNKESLAAILRDNHSSCIQYLQSLSDADFLYAPEGKWSAGQQLDHLLKSVKPVNMAMGLPKFIVQWKFGVANRPSKTYEQLVEKYQGKLQQGGTAPGAFIPTVVKPENKEILLQQLASLSARLAKKTETHTEEALDKYILPHPLLGKLTFREMLYFTAYHVQHHQSLVKKGLENR